MLEVCELSLHGSTLTGYFVGIGDGDHMDRMQ